MVIEQEKMTTGEERSWETPKRREPQKRRRETKQAQTGMPTGNEEKKRNLKEDPTKQRGTHTTKRRNERNRNR